MEQQLRDHREHALKLLRENRGQTREGIDLLVRERLSTLAGIARPEGPLPPEQLERLYAEVLDLSYLVFSLGYTMARTLEPSKK